MRLDSLDYTLLSIIGLHTLIAPFTKVEESFNIQAIHDMIFYGLDLAKYDHNEFPGVVPRSFVGALALSGLTKPVQLWLGHDSKFDLQIIARGLLGVINAFALISFKHDVEQWARGRESPRADGKGGLKADHKEKREKPKESTDSSSRYSKLLSSWFSIFCVCQFHLMFYSSRTLPNMLAFPLVMFSYGRVLKDNHFMALILLGFATIVFRIELVLLWVGLAVSALAMKKISIAKAIQAGIVGVGCGSVISCAVDSYFWQQFPMIPELRGFLFNAIQGKSSEWGEEPWHSYVITHIPNMLNNPLLISLLPIGMLSDPSPSKGKALQILCGAAFFFVSFYSLHAHKEWRFVIYIMPLLSLVAANAMALVQTARWSNIAIKFVIVALVGISVVFSLASEAVKTFVSSYNYPGGVALAEFHDYIHSEYGRPPVLPTGNPLVVHLDVLTCMTGASRFGQLYDEAVFRTNYIVYNKAEDPDSLSEQWQTFDLLITGVDIAKSKLPCKQGYHWEQIRAIEGFAGFNMAPVFATVERLKKREFAGPIVDLAKEISSEGIKAFFSKIFSTLIRLENQVFIYKKVITGDGNNVDAHCYWIREDVK